MTKLVEAFSQGGLLRDDFIRQHVQDLLRTIRTQVLMKLLHPSTRIPLQAIAKELNHVAVERAEQLLYQVTGILVIQVMNTNTNTKSLVVRRCETLDENGICLGEIVQHICGVSTSQGFVIAVCFHAWTRSLDG